MTEVSKSSRFFLNAEKVRGFLPHRYPFLLIDRILDIVPPIDSEELAPQKRIGTRVKGLKNFTANEEFFQGHFPQFRLVPGVLQLEMMAQTAGFTLYPTVEKHPEDFVKSFRYILTGVNDARFRKEITPGDTLIIETELLKVKGPLWIFGCRATVEGRAVSEAEIMANLIPC